jgi:sulfatase maturation enzyme AslB (radical SAM superfamily)
MPLYDSFIKYPNKEMCVNRIKKLLSTMKTFTVLENNTTKRNVVLNITNKCNLKCPYCWAKSSPDTTMFMNEITAVSIVKKLWETYDVQRLHFMGGEPTQNILAIKAVVNLLRNEYKKEPTYYITTNGVIDKSLLMWLIKNNFAFTVSLDSANNREADARHLVNGGSQYKQTIKTIKLLIDNNIHFRVRITVAKHNLQNIKSTLEDLGIMGVKYVHIEKMIYDGRTKTYMNNYDIPNVLFHNMFYELIEVANRYKIGLMNSNLANLFSPSNSFCRALKTRVLNINPDCSISHCYKANNNITAINKEFVVGTYDEMNEKIYYDMERSEYLTNMNTTENAMYSKTPYLYYWSGGCVYKNYSSCKDWDNVDKESYNLAQMMLTTAIEKVYEYSIKKQYSPLEGFIGFYENMSNGEPASEEISDKYNTMSAIEEEGFIIIPIVKKYNNICQIEACDICI